MIIIISKISLRCEIRFHSRFSNIRRYDVLLVLNVDHMRMSPTGVNDFSLM